MKLVSPQPLIHLTFCATLITDIANHSNPASQHMRLPWKVDMLRQARMDQCPLNARTHLTPVRLRRGVLKGGLVN